MEYRPDSSEAPVKGSVPGNPLRTYRMSMLAHGFVDQPDRSDFEPDDTDPIAYGVVRKGGRIPTVAAITVGLLLVVLIGAGFLLG